MWLDKLSSTDSSQLLKSVNVNQHTAGTFGYRVRGEERHTLQPPPRNTPHVTAEIQIETNGQSNTVYEG